MQTNDKLLDLERELIKSHEIDGLEWMRVLIRTTIYV